jgi:RNA polymerase primary sigma factor
VQQILKMSREPLSLEAPIGEDGIHLGDFIEDSQAVVPAEAASDMLLQEHIGSVLRSLSEREKKVIELRFGLLDGHPRTLEEVGREFHPGHRLSSSSDRRCPRRGAPTGWSPVAPRAPR